MNIYLIKLTDKYLGGAEIRGDVVKAPVIVGKG